jgi:2,5-diketo-D-gluconate reductase B
VLECCRKHKIAVTAYMPLAKGRVIDNPVLRAIGKAHGATPNQVSLAWLMGLGAIVIPASGSRKHLESNFAASAVRLSEADNAAIAALDRGERIIDPPDSPEWD